MQYDDSFIKDIALSKIGYSKGIIFYTPTVKKIGEVNDLTNRISFDTILIQCIWNMGELTCNHDKKLDMPKFYLNFNVINQDGILITDDKTYHVFTAFAEYLASIQTSEHYKALKLDDYLVSLQNALSSYTNKSTLPDPNTVFKDIYSEINTTNKRMDMIFFTIELVSTIALILSAVASGGSTLSLGLGCALLIAVVFHFQSGFFRRSLTRIKKQHNELNDALTSESRSESIKSPDTLITEIEQDLAKNQLPCFTRL